MQSSGINLKRKNKKNTSKVYEQGMALKPTKRDFIFVKIPSEKSFELFYLLL